MQPNQPIYENLKAALLEVGYSQAGLTEQLGSAAPVTRADLNTTLLRTSEATPLNCLIRLFHLGVEVPEDLGTAALPAKLLSDMTDQGWLRLEQESIQASVAISVIDEYHFFSDSFNKLAGGDASSFVLPGNTQAGRRLKQIMLAQQGSRALDMCCGCGVHAVLLSDYYEQVVAADISPVALDYARLNAAFNGKSNITFIQSDFFADLAEQRFDHIVCNPPFVLGPEQVFDYRDNPLPLDELCAQLIQRASAHLAEGGYLQMPCEWTEVSGETWRERVDGWFNNSDCDAFVLRGSPLTPGDYVALRSSDLTGPGLHSTAGLQRWLDYFAEHSVLAVHPALLTLRKRTGANWVHYQSVGPFPDGDLGAAVQQGIEACDTAAALQSDQALLQATLRVNPQAELEQNFVREEQQWAPARALLKLPGPLQRPVEADMAVLAFLNNLDGTLSCEQAIRTFAEASRADTARLQVQLLPVMRLLISNRLLLIKSITS